MQKIAFQLEFLVVMNAVENVSGDFKEMLDELLISEIRGAGVNGPQHLSVALECFVLKLFIGVYLIALGLQDPAESLRVHVVYIAFVQLEGIAVVFKDFVVVNLGEVLAEEELSGLRVLLCFDIIEFHFHFVVFVGLALPRGSDSPKPTDPCVIDGG